MPLNPTVLADALAQLGTTTDIVGARRRHAAAFRTYMNDVVTVPPLTPIQHDAAELAMTVALVGQEAPAPAGLLAVNNGYTAYVSTLIVSFGASWVPAIPPIPPGPFSSAPPNGLGAVGYALQVHQWVTKVSGSIPPIVPTPWT